MLPTLDQAFTLHRAGRLAEAESAYRAILEGSPEDGAVRRGLGLLLIQSGRGAEAVDVLQPVVESQPDAELLNTCGAAQMQTGAWAAAKSQFQAALALDPAHAKARANLGAAHYRLGEVKEAVEALTRAAARQPENAETYFNLSLALRASNRLDEAEQAARKAIALSPNSANAHVAMGVIHAAKGDREDAIKSYRKGLDIDPRAAEAHHNLAQVLLAGEQLADGWDEFEWRWHTSDFAGADQFLHLPAWDGRPLSGGTLLVWTEQGVGDQILYAGLIPDLQAQEFNIIIACETRLVPLFERSFPFAEILSQAQILADESRCPSITAQVPAGSLGRFLRRQSADFPDRTRYLVADPVRVDHLRHKYKESAGAKPLVGLAWSSGNPRFGAAKSVPLPSFAAALSEIDAQVVDLQYGDTTFDRQAAAAVGLNLLKDPDIDAQADLDSFAAQVAALDLVISISNSTAHFAGALGVPGWVLIPEGQGRFWYWFLDRADSPWYPSLRLFRQASPDSWDDVMAAIGAALRQRFPATS
jgi:Flp pilus assembly protein TadD